jgi:hypothetical protein
MGIGGIKPFLEIFSAGGGPIFRQGTRCQATVQDFNAGIWIGIEEKCH